MATPIPPTTPKPSAPDRELPREGNARRGAPGFRETLGQRSLAKDPNARRGAGGRPPPELSEPPKAAGPASRRRTLLDSPENELQPFLPLPGIVRAVKLSPPPGLAQGSVDRAAELAALVDRAVESLRVGRSAEGHEARVLSEGVDRPEARALAERLERGLSDRGLVDVRVDIGSLDG